MLRQQRLRGLSAHVLKELDDAVEVQNVHFLMAIRRNAQIETFELCPSGSRSKRIHTVKKLYK